MDEAVGLLEQWSEEVEEAEVRAKEKERDAVLARKEVREREKEAEAIMSRYGRPGTSAEAEAEAEARDAGGEGGRGDEQQQREKEEMDDREEARYGDRVRGGRR